MYLDSIEKQLKTMIDLKKDNDYKNYNIRELSQLTSYSGIWELKFRDNTLNNHGRVKNQRKLMYVFFITRLNSNSKKKLVSKDPVLS